MARPFNAHEPGSRDALAEELRSVLRPRVPGAMDEQTWHLAGVTCHEEPIGGIHSGTATLQPLLNDSSGGSERQLQSRLWRYLRLRGWIAHLSSSSLSLHWLRLSVTVTSKTSSRESKPRAVLVHGCSRFTYHH